MRKSRQILASLTLIAILSIAYYLFEHQKKSVPKPIAFQGQESQRLFPRKEKKLSKNVPLEAKESFDCYQHLNEKVIKCDLDCYNKFLATKDSELFSFIDEGGFDETLKRNPTSKLGRFLFALSKAGMDTYTKTNIDFDIEFSIKALRELVAEDPQNILPRLYLATVLDMNGNTREAHDELKTASHLPLFNDYSLDWVRRLYLVSMSNPQYVLHAIIYQSRLPIASLKEMRDLLEKHPKEGTVIARILVNNGDPLEGGVDMVDWMPVQYAVGLKFLERYSPSEAAALPNYSDLFNKNMEKLESEVGGFPTEIQDCNIEYLGKYGKSIIREINHKGDHKMIPPQKKLITH